MIKQLLRMNFRSKIFLTLSLLIFSSLLLVIFIIQSFTEKKVEEDFGRRFQQTIEAFRQLQDLQTQFISNEISSLASTNAQFRTVLSSASVQAVDLGFGDESETDYADANLRLRSILPTLVIHQKSDIFIVTNAQGELLYTKVDQEYFGKDLSQLKILRSLFQGMEAKDYWHNALGHETSKQALVPTAEEAVFQVIARPVAFGNQIHGAVIVGNIIADEALAQLKTITGLDILLFGERDNNKRSFSTTINNLQLKTTVLMQRLPKSLLNVARRTLPVGRFAAQNEEFIYVPSALTTNNDMDIGFIFIQSLSRELAFLEALKNTLALVGCLIILFALMIGYWLSRGISKPVAVLSEAAEKIGAGDFDTRVTIRSGDEMQYLGETFNQMTAGLKEREFLKSTFERYVSKEIAQEIIKNPDLIKIGGVEKEITVLFADLPGFTRYFERMAPEDAIKRLNQFFETVGDLIFEYNGTLNQFQGDAIIAFWGAPIDQPNHAELACKAAMRCQQQLALLSKEWHMDEKSGQFFRIGINSGKAIVGNFGSETRFSYTAHGDDVNLAARLETANKFYGTHSLISAASYHQAEHAIVAREIDTIVVVGKSKPVTVYELINFKESMTAEQEGFVGQYHLALEYYKNREWLQAKQGFEQCLEKRPDDRPTKVMIERMRHYSENPPDAGWNGVFELVSK